MIKFLKLILFFGFVSLIFTLSIFISQRHNLNNERQIRKMEFSTTPNPSKRVKEKTKGLEKNQLRGRGRFETTIFVPEWQINQLESVESVEISQSPLNQYQRVIYFGGEENFDIFNKIKRLQQNFKGELWFTVKITEIPDKKNRSSIVENTVNIAKKYNLQGVALDLEINSLPTDDLVGQINNFVQDFRDRVKIEDLKLAVILYGDIFYRVRPFDVKFLAENSDEVMIMAYDFHKSYGEPGPNFPFEGREKYGYDFKTMINDFLKFVEIEKLTVIFGMYGYDWQVDEKKRPIKQAKALTLKQIKGKFLTMASWQRSNKNDIPFFARESSCLFDNCLIKRDDLSKEIEINYVVSSKQADEQGIYRLDYHIVWFEDEESVKIKTNFLKEKGIGSIAYWAWGYF